MLGKERCKMSEVQHKKMFSGLFARVTSLLLRFFRNHMFPRLGTQICCRDMPFYFFIYANGTIHVLGLQKSYPST